MKSLADLLKGPQQRAQEAEYPLMDESQEEGQGFDRWPIPVHLASQSAELTRSDAADRASYITIPISLGSPGPFQVLPYSPNRHRALVFCTGTAVQLMLNKSLPELQAAIPNGFIINNGTQVTLENVEPLYLLLLAGTNVTASVIEERWITDPKE